MSKAPVMPVIVDALIGDTIHLSAEEFGAYSLLLFATWRNNGIAFKNDDNLLARICRLTPARWRKMRPVIEPFFDISDGTWRQYRLEKQWEYVAEKAERSRSNGKKGGRPATAETEPKPEPRQKPNGFPESKQNESHHNHIHTQEPEGSLVNAGAKKRARRYFVEGEPMHADFAKVADEYEGFDQDLEWQKFRDYHLSKNQPTGSMAASARTWMTNAVSFGRARLRQREEVPALPLLGPAVDNTKPKVKDEDGETIVWRAKVRAFYERGYWDPNYGPKPGQRFCEAPAHVVAEFAGRAVAS